ncbi:hypothetical protein INT45_011430 [Circinella minor]|uniref:Uncharacterized protein n=1 Tax=Circinella minor TaxID=1195481 RepID=A0A8H7SCK5_9FUNG|nr:hypothetical protein INT45_011430 [Circinella minor]
MNIPLDLLGLIKALLRDPKIDRTGSVSDNEVLKASYDKSLKSDEIAVVKLIANQLLPYAPHSESMCLLTQLPFILLANSILIAVGYHDHVQEISPIVSPHNIHAIPTNPAIIYETLTLHKNGISQGPFEEYVGKSLQQLLQQLDYVEDMINKMTAARDILKTKFREAIEEWNRTKTERLKSCGTIKRLLSQKLKGQVYAKRKKSHLLKLARRDIKDWRSSQYNLNKVIENHSTTGALPVDVPPTKPTPERVQHEDVAANIDISRLHFKKVAYGTTDYGHVVLAQTVPLTNDDVQFHVHLYNQQQEYQQQQLEQIESLVNLEKAEFIDDSEEKQEVDFISSQLQQQ